MITKEGTEFIGQELGSIAEVLQLKQATRNFGTDRETPIDYDEDTREKCCLHADDNPHIEFERPSNGAWNRKTILKEVAFGRIEMASEYLHDLVSEAVTSPS